MASKLFYKEQHDLIIGVFNLHVVLAGSHVCISFWFGGLWRWQRFVAAACRLGC
jgi:hypothetical protein